MPHADVVVIGAGLAGLTAAGRLAEAGAQVTLVAKGHTTTHWAAGGIDVAAPPGAHTPAEGVARLAGLDDHPYAMLHDDVEPAVAWLTDRLAALGLPYAGDLAAPIRRVPTAIGGTRRVGIVPEAQAAARRPWDRDEVLVVAGPAGFKDFWPAAVADSLGREAVWHGADRPARIVGVAVELDGLSARNNCNALDLARRFDDPETRARDLDRLARAIGQAAGRHRGRVALPAVLGLDGHADALAAARAHLPLDPFEIPLVPPSLPGTRLWLTMRRMIRANGGRIQVGEFVRRIQVEGDRVIAVEVEAATRAQVIRTDAVILATGGLAGGGLVATGDGRVVEPLLNLHVDAPDHDAWLVREALDPAGHPIEAAGIRTDADLRPLDPVSGRAAYPNLRVAGALLAGQRALRERSGDGIAIASGWRAAEPLIAPAGAAAERRPASVTRSA